MSSMADRTRRVIEGALRDAITQHGPITHDGLPSATKRVLAQLRSAAEEVTMLAPGLDGGQAAAEAAHKRLQKLRHGHGILQSQYDRLRVEHHALAEVVRYHADHCQPGPHDILAAAIAAANGKEST